MVRFEVDRDRWLRWADDQARRAQRVAYIVAGTVLLAGLVPTAILYFDEGKPVEATWAGAITLVAAGLAALGVTLATRRSPPPGVGPLPFLVGPRMVLTPGWIFRFIGFGTRFIDAALRTDGPSLVIRYAVRGKNDEVEHTLEIPIPAAQLAEADAIVEALNGT